STPRSSFNSPAALLFEDATGRPPHGHGLPAVAGHLGGATPSARKAEPGLPAALDAVLQRGLANDPDDRQPSCGELAAAFLEATAGADRRPARRAAAGRRPGRAAVASRPTSAVSATPTGRSWPRYAYDLDTQSEVVRAIQLLLVGHGLDVGPPGPDGVYGALTQNAVQQFQRQSSLPTDGVVDAGTWERLVVTVDTGRRGVEVEA